MAEATENRAPRPKSTEAGRKVPRIGREMVARALQAKAEGKPVAYTFIQSLYYEIIRAMDIVPLWVEHYAGVVAAKRDQARFLGKAEAEGFSRFLCTYATCDLGFEALRRESGEMPPDPPWGGMAKPDMMLGTGQMLCEPRYKWFQAAQRYMPEVPFHIMDLPWPPYEEHVKLEEVEGYYFRHVLEELRSLVRFLEAQTHRRMDPDRLWATIDLAERTYKVWWDCLNLCKSVPTPMGTDDEMNTMVPGQFLLGTQEALTFYQDLFGELKYRVDNKIGVVPNEEYRVLWGGGLPPWFALNDFEYFKTKGAVFPAEVPYRPWWNPDLDIPKVSDPLEHLAWRWMKYHSYRHRKAMKRPGSHPDVEHLIGLIEEFKIDGILMHLAFSCRSWHVGLIWQLNTLAKVYRDIPSLVLESDMVDASSYSEADTHAQIDAFVETMETHKMETHKNR